MSRGNGAPRVAGLGGGAAASGKCDELRSLIRVAASSDSSVASASSLLTGLFLGQGGGSGSTAAATAATAAATSSEELARDKFCSVISTVRGVRARFTPNDLIDIYNEAAAEITGGGLTTKVTGGAMVDYFSSVMSKPRAWSIKLRSIIMQDFEGIDGYKNAFGSIASTGSKKVVEVNAFTDFAEDMLDLEENSITESEAKALYGIFDVNNDGELSLDDFLSFMLGQSAEAIQQLSAGNGEVIVDVKVSTMPGHEVELRAQGYTQVNPDSTGVALGPDFGSFGKGCSLWIWRRKQGTCSGRLKPIVDIHLDAASPSSNSVLVGYQSISIPLGGHCVWIKRATNEEEEIDAIVDVKVTVGKSKNPADKIWDAGVGWVLVGQGAGANFAPKGVLFSSQDAFLWFRPMRARTMDSAMVSVLNAAAGLTDESRQAKLLAAMRSAVRNHVPLNETKRLANLQMESNELSARSQIRSERLFDYAALFHRYGDVTRGFMARSKFQKMLIDVGVNMDAADMNRCFNYLDKDLDGKISRVEFSHVMSLTGFEVDVIVDKIRTRLLAKNSAFTTSSSSSSSSAGSSSSALSSSSSSSASSSGAAGKGGILDDPKSKNALRESRILSHIFRHVNENHDNILSLDEILDLAARLEIFLTEDEARRIARDMDVNGDDRVEEADFITFMKRGSEVVVKKANRLFEAAGVFRRWLIAGTKTASSSLLSISPEQWNEFKVKHDKSMLRKFPGYLSSDDLLRMLAGLGVLLTGTEARELLLLIAPEANGQIRQEDLNTFMNRSCRSLGELVALLEREVMKNVVETYRASWNVIRVDGVPDSQLADNFASSVKYLVERVQTSQASSVISRSGMTSPGASKVSATHEVVSAAQLKAGVEASMGRVPSQGAGMMPNLEEYSCLAALVGALVADEETSGVNAKKFVEGVCAYVVKYQDSKALGRGGETVSLDALCRDLRRMIREEAKAAGGGRTFDFVTVFSSFDEDGGGTISLSEFKGILKRFQLIEKLPEKQVPALLECFDRTKKGHVTFEDFLAFVETNRDEDDDDYALDDDDQADDIGLSSNTPPSSITRNPDCDWLLWFLWRQACRVSPRDPENVIAEMEASCVAAEKRAGNSGSSSSGAAAAVSATLRGEVTVKTFWNILGDKKLQGTMTRGQFEKGVRFVVHDGTGKDDDPMDYESVAKYTVRMGRAFNGLLQQRRVVDEKKFSQLSASLKKELLDIDASSSAGASLGSAEDDGAVAAPLGSSSNISSSRFERVLRRLDTNTDGMLTVPEFKMALKRLKIRDEKKWSAAMVRRLFDETTSRTDGKLSIAEFSKHIHGDSKSGGFGASSGKSRGGQAPGELSDDEEDDVFSAPKSSLSDAALLRKASDILLELVPMVSSSYSPGAMTAHCDAVRAAVRHFFIKGDPHGRGCVSEEEFRIFARKSGLQTRMRVAELRRLVGKLRKRAGDGGVDGDDGDGRLYSGRGVSSTAHDSLVDYERLCKYIGPGSSDSQPRSRIDALMLRVQEAADISTAQGRSFLALCTLTDPMLSGHISETELTIVMKMLGCPLTPAEVDILRDQVADLEVENQRVGQSKGEAAGSRSPDGRSGKTPKKAPKNSIDYRAVNVLIQTYQTARPPAPSYDSLSASEMRHSTRALGALPAYAGSTGGGFGFGHGAGLGGSAHVTRVPATTIRGVPPLDIARAVPTPGGLFVTTPLPASAAMRGHESGLGLGLGLGAGTWAGRSLRSSSPGAAAPLASAYDRSVSGLADKIKAHARRAQSSLPPVLLLRRRLETAADLHGGLTRGGQGAAVAVAEEALQVVLEDMGIALAPADLYALRSRFGDMRGGFEVEALCGALADALAESSGGAAALGGWDVPVAVARRVRELVAEGVSIRQAFADFDFDGNGVIEVRRFVEIVRRLSLLQSERQLSAAIDCFASHSDKSLVSYADFCQACERAEAVGRAADDDYGNGSGSSSYGNSGLLRSSRSGGGVGVGVGVGGGDRELGRSFVFGSGYDGVAARASREWGSSAADDDLGGSGSGSGYRSRDFSGRPPLGRSSSSSNGRSLGAGVGSLSASYGASSLGRDAWACSVCLYADNPATAAKCVVCDSADLSKKQRGGSGCSNCRFQNDFDALDCAMCGLPV